MSVLILALFSANEVVFTTSGYLQSTEFAISPLHLQGELQYYYEEEWAFTFLKLELEKIIAYNSLQILVQPQSYIFGVMRSQPASIKSVILG